MATFSQPGTSKAFKLVGGTGKDTLTGGDGADIISGGDDADIISGGKGGAKDKKSNDMDSDFIYNIYYTKLYWCIKRCVGRNPKDRGYIYI